LIISHGQTGEKLFPYDPYSEYVRLNLDMDEAATWVVHENRIVLKSVLAEDLAHLSKFHYRGTLLFLSCVFL
jgi:hypothetical protein